MRVGAGDEPAILVGSRVVTWAGLDRRVDALAGELRSRGRARRAVSWPSPASPTLGDGRRGSWACSGPAAVAASLPVALTAAETRRGDARPRCPSSRSGARRALAPAAGRLDEPGVVVLTSGTTARPEGRGAVRARAGGQRGRLARRAAARDGLAPGAGPRARGRPRRRCGARSRRACPIADRRRIRRRPRSPGPSRRPTVSHVSLVPTQLARLLDAAGDAPPPPTCGPCRWAAGSSRRRS